MNNILKIKPLAYVIGTLLLCSCNSGGLSGSGTSNSGASGNEVQGDTASLMGLGPNFYSEDVGVGTSYKVGSSVNSSGAVLYKNDVALPVVNGLGRYSVSDDRKMYAISPTAVGSQLIIADPFEVRYTNLGDAIAGSTGKFGWNTVGVGDIKAGIAGTAKLIASPIVRSDALDQLTSESNLFMIVTDQKNYLHIVKSTGDAKTPLGASWYAVSLNQTYIQSQHDNFTYSAPLAVVTNNNGIFFFTAGQNSSDPHGDELLNLTAFSSLEHTPETGLPTASNQQIIGITYSNNHLYVLYAGGSLYVADMSKYDSDTNNQLNFSMVGTFAGICSAPSFAKSYYDSTSAIQSNIIAATESGVDLCQRSQILQVNTESNNIPTTSSLPIPNGLAAQAIAVSNTGVLGVVVYSNTGQKILLNHPGSSNFALLTTDYNYPLALNTKNVISSIGFDDLDRIYANSSTGSGGMILAANYMDGTSAHWVSLGAKFNLNQITAANTKIAYAGISGSSRSHPLPIGKQHVALASDGNYWFAYNQDQESQGNEIVSLGKYAINYPDKNDGLAQLAMSNNYIFALSNNGYVLAHSQNLKDNNKWTTVYDPSVTYWGLNAPAGLATKLIATPTEKGLSVHNSDSVSFIAKDTNGVGHLMWLNMNDKGVIAYPGAESFNVVSAQVTNTDPQAANFKNSAMMVLTSDGAMYGQMMITVAHDDHAFYQIMAPGSTSVLNSQIAIPCLTPNMESTPADIGNNMNNIPQVAPNIMYNPGFMVWAVDFSSFTVRLGTRQYVFVTQNENEVILKVYMEGHLIIINFMGQDGFLHAVAILPDSWTDDALDLDKRFIDSGAIRINSLLDLPTAFDGLFALLATHQPPIQQTTVCTTQGQYSSF